MTFLFLTFEQMMCAKVIAKGITIGKRRSRSNRLQTADPLNWFEEADLTLPHPLYVPLHQQNAIHTFLDPMFGFEKRKLFQSGRTLPRPRGTLV